MEQTLPRKCGGETAERQVMLRVDDEIVESNEQFVGMWSAFARRFPGSRVERLPGLTVAVSGTPMAFVNVIAFSSPIEGREDLVRRCRLAVEIGTESGLPWLLSTCDPWMGDPEEAQATLAEFHFMTSLPTIGMVAEDLTPAKPVPQGLELRRVKDQATRCDLVDLNTLAYGIPEEIGRQGPAQECFWDDSFHGYVAYLDNNPVACTMTAPLDGRLYVSWVATHPEHRRKGYADAVMRKSLASAREASGISRTVLHATVEGQPVYERMGYRNVVGFTWYALDH